MSFEKIKSALCVTLAVIALSLAIALFIVIDGQAQSIPSKRECVVATYRSQIGVGELTGNNDGEQVEIYLASVGLSKGQPWCAAFVNWCMKSCSAPRAKSGWSPAWFPQDKVIHSGKGKVEVNAGYAPRAGDVFGIFFPTKGRIAHVGFIDEWKGERVRTVEGNTNEAGSREGRWCLVKYRIKNQISVVANWIDK